MRQDADLCVEIMMMRHFARLYETMKRDKKQLTPEDWAFLEAMDKLQEAEG